MQIGIAHVVAFFVGIALLVGGAFAAGTKWNVHDAEAQSAVAEMAVDAAGASTNNEEIPAPADAPLYKVLRVVDGDTIVVEIGGKSESVRMIGVDTPELNDSRTGVQCFAKEASEKTKSLVTGKNVRLEKDDSQGERDKYKRLLAYVFAEDGTFVNRALIQDGYAHEYTYDQPYKYQKQFKAAEVAARGEEVGLWSEDNCPTTPAVRPAKSAPKIAPKVAPKTTQKESQAAAAAAAAAQPTQQPIAQPAVQPTTTPQQEPKKEEPKAAPKAEPEPEPDPEPPPAAESGAIICSRNAYNCTDFKTQEEAQKVYDECGGVDNDIHKLDKNKDGNACDSLP